MFESLGSEVFHNSEFFVVCYATVLVESGAPVPSQIHNYSCNENYDYSLHMINKGSKKIHESSGQVLPPNEFAANFPKTFSFQDVLESGIVYKRLWTCTIMDPPYE